MLKELERTEAWEWPPNAPQILLDHLNDPKKPLKDRVLAAYLAGELPEFDDLMGQALLSLIEDPEADPELRATSSIALGPALELCDVDGYDDDGFSDPPLSEPLFEKVLKGLRKVLMNPDVPVLARRRALEAAVRAPRDWQRPMVEDAYRSDIEELKMTAVFCMRFLKGFDQQILDSLDDPAPLVLIEALQAAGVWELKKAWPRVAGILQSEEVDRDLLLTAIEVAQGVGKKKADLLLTDLLDHEDEEVAAMAEAALGDYD